MAFRIALSSTIALLLACAAHEERRAGRAFLADAARAGTSAPAPGADAPLRIDTAPSRAETRRAAAGALFGDTLDGHRIDLSGPGPVRLVELWATWCEPCGPAAEIARPVLRRHPGVTAYSLALDEREAVARHLVSQPVLGTVLVYPGGIGAATKRGLRDLPMFVALDAHGRVAGTIVGLRPGLAANLDRLLNQAQGRSGRVE